MAPHGRSIGSRLITPLAARFGYYLTRSFHIAASESTFLSKAGTADGRASKSPSPCSNRSGAFDVRFNFAGPTTVDLAFGSNEKNMNCLRSPVCENGGCPGAALRRGLFGFGRPSFLALQIAVSYALRSSFVSCEICFCGALRISRRCVSRTFPPARRRYFSRALSTAAMTFGLSKKFPFAARIVKSNALGMCHFHSHRQPNQAGRDSLFQKL